MGLPMIGDVSCVLPPCSRRTTHLAELSFEAPLRRVIVPARVLVVHRRAAAERRSATGAAGELLVVVASGRTVPTRRGCRLKRRNLCTNCGFVYGNGRWKSGNSCNFGLALQLLLHSWNPHSVGQVLTSKCRAAVEAVDSSIVTEA